MFQCRSRFIDHDTLPGGQTLELEAYSIYIGGISGRNVGWEMAGYLPIDRIFETANLVNLEDRIRGGQCPLLPQLRPRRSKDRSRGSEDEPYFRLDRVAARHP